MTNRQIRPEWVPEAYKETSANKSSKNIKEICMDILFGVAIGDALGVPAEFKSRDQMSQNPVTDMIGWGTHGVPPGTFSDDSSLTFCLAEAIADGFTMEKLGANFVKWRYQKYWTARNEVFDVGNTTQNAIDRIVAGEKPEFAGDFDEGGNGNGSLMRILPLLVYIKDKPVAERYQVIKQVSSVTHMHVRSVIACFYYIEFAMGLLKGGDKFAVYQRLQVSVAEYLRSSGIVIAEREIFNRLLIDRIDMMPEEQISSSGYVVHTLEAGIWCLLTTDNYKDAVLKAVNLGSDTDTTAAVTGGLAALLYGHQTVPESWLGQLARKDDIADLAERMAALF